MLGRYLLRRLLLAIPTTFAILLALFALVNAVPTHDGTPDGEVVIGSERLREARRVFREHFALHLPVFANLRHRVAPERIRDLVLEAVAPSVGSPTEILDEIEAHGRFAVSPLVELAGDGTAPAAARDLALRILVTTTRPIVRLGDPPDERETELLLLRELAVLAPPEGELTAADRERLAARWRDHTRGHAARYAAPSGLERVKVTLLETRFATYLRNIARLDFGNSLADRQPVLPVFRERVGRSAAIGVGYLLLAFSAAIPLALFIESRRRRTTRRLLDVFLFAFYSLPGFFTALLLQRWLAGGKPFAWFPLGGIRSVTAEGAGSFVRTLDFLHHLCLPVLVLALPSIVVLTRLLQGSLAAALASDYVAAARSRGLSRRAVLFRHALRNALLPLATAFGATLPVLIGGAASIEFMFDIPGAGLYLLDAVLTSDFNVVLVVTLFSALATQAGFLVSDLLCAWLDPRIRLGATR